MQISLHNIVPIPLKEKFAHRSSGIWNSEVAFLPGQWIKIKAPSGTGKTTLMNILYKIRHDYEGTVTYDDRDLKLISTYDLSRIRQQQLSVIFQDLQLFTHLTARENIELKRVM